MVKGGLISPGVCFEGIWKLLGQIPIEKKKRIASLQISLFTHMDIYKDENAYTPRRNGQTSTLILGSTPCIRYIRNKNSNGSNKIMGH